MIFFTSDQHYFHKNIITHCNRPFTDMDHMNASLINNHNEIVGPRDKVYHLGDFTFGGLYEFQYLMVRLNGIHVFVQGSHDKWAKNWCPLQRIIDTKIGNYYFTLCHYPMLSWPKIRYGSIHLHGHCHGRLPLDTKIRRYDVGVDPNNYRPVSIENILNRIK